MEHEVVHVSSDEAGILRDGVIRVYAGLLADSVHDIDGVSLRTLPRPGEHLATIATVNDVHFGETICGYIDGDEAGPVFSVAKDAEPYPSMMNRHVVDELLNLQPDALVVKGDLTSNGTQEEYEQFLACYGDAFGDRMTHVRGNHESYHGLDVAMSPLQEVWVEGAIVALLDTSRNFAVNGDLSSEQLDALDELASRADRPVLVMGHHPIWDARYQARSDDVFGLRPGATEGLLELFSRRPRLVAYAAGHTHRTSVLEINAVPFAEIASTKEFPGAWCEYQIFDEGILQIVHRASHAEALAWSEKTRAMYAGAFGDYAYGSLGDRCRLIDTH